MKDTPSTLDVNARIARQVGALRRQLGYSLAALAAKCDVSRSMISLIERGETSATAVVLEKLAAGLGVALATLFEDSAAAPSPLARASDRKPWRDPETGYVRRNISPANFPSPIQIVAVTLPAGARVAYESGPRDTTIHQQIWVQSGQLELTIGRETHTLAADDCLAMTLDAPVIFRNRTRKPVHYVVVLASPRARAARLSHEP
jgi:transcriptional regulator with XRE-family HTH domain